MARAGYLGRWLRREVASVAVVREVVIVVHDTTRHSAAGTLPRRAVRAIGRCEALGTMKPVEKDFRKRQPRGSLETASINGGQELGWDRMVNISESLQRRDTKTSQRR